MVGSVGMFSNLREGDKYDILLPLISKITVIYLTVIKNEGNHNLSKSFIRATNCSLNFYDFCWMMWKLFNGLLGKQIDEQSECFITVGIFSVITVFELNTSDHEHRCNAFKTLKLFQNSHKEIGTTQHGFDSVLVSLLSALFFVLALVVFCSLLVSYFRIYCWWSGRGQRVRTFCYCRAIT